MMDDSQPCSSSSSSQSQQPGPSIDQDKIVFAFEREYYENFVPLAQEKKPPKPTTSVLFNPFQSGLQLRDQELVDFLNDRLGDHEETWAGKHVAAFLSREMIEELETCFQGLEPIAKLKIVLGFSQLSTKRLNDWSKEINTLLEIAARDPDDWVEAISDNLRNFSPSGSLELDPTKNVDVYRAALGRVYHKLAKCANKPKSRYCHIPECYKFCDETVLETELNYIAPPAETHFSVRKVLKGDLLREEVLREIYEPKPVEEKNSSGFISSLPMKYRSTLRKPDLKTPMKGIVQPNATKINGGFTSEPRKFPRQLAKRDGGAMLIAIDDIPHATLKKRKEIEKEEREKRKQEADIEKKKAEAERKKALLEKAELKKQAMRDAEKIREETMRKRKEMETAVREVAQSTVRSRPPPPKPVDPIAAFSDPCLELEILRQKQQKPQPPKVNEKKEEDVEMTDVSEEAEKMKSEADKAVEWMFHHDDISASKIGESREDDYEFLNRPRPPGLESRETIIQKTTTDVLDTVTCCTLEQQRQIVAFFSGNKAKYRPMLGNTNIVKISDCVQQGLVDDHISRIRVETFIHMNFDSGEWRKQQKCKVLQGEEIPRDLDSSQCPRLTHQQIYNEIARNIGDEPEDKKFAGESVIVQAYVPSAPQLELKLQDESGRLLSPSGGGEVLYGQEVTPGEMQTVQTGISGCTGMRTILGAAASSALLASPLILSPTQLHPPKPQEMTVAQALNVPQRRKQRTTQMLDHHQLPSTSKQPTAARNPPVQHVRPMQQAPPRPAPAPVPQLTIDPAQMLQLQQQLRQQQQHQNFGVQQAPFFVQDVVRQPVQQVQQQQPLPMPINQMTIPQFVQHSMNRVANIGNNAPNAFFAQQQQFTANGAQILAMGGANLPQFNLMPNPQQLHHQQLQPLPPNNQPFPIVPNQMQNAQFINAQFLQNQQFRY